LSEATQEAVSTSPPATWSQKTFASLSHRQFRFFWISNLIVSVGLMVQFVARGWMVVQITDSALVLGAVEGTWAVAFALGSIPMGLAADRFNRRNLLVLGSFLALLAAVVVAILIVTDVIAIWHLLIAGAVTGVLFAMRVPAGQAMTARLVPPKNLMNAISLNQTAHSLPNVAGPAAGGILIAVAGIAGAYFVTSGAFFLGLLLILGVSASFGAIQRTTQAKSVKQDLGEAIDYLREHKDLLQLTAAMLIPFILGQSYVLLLPLFVEQELGLGPEAFGALSACLGAGAVVGGLSVATFGEERQIGLLMFLGVLGTGVAAVAYGLSESVYLTGAVLFVAGAGESALFASYDTLLLMRLPDEIRGRVMGLMFTLVAMFPIGAIGAGAAADIVGLRTVAIVEGTIIIAMSYLAWRTVFRRAVAR